MQGIAPTRICSSSKSYNDATGEKVQILFLFEEVWAGYARYMLGY
jgi:hypothetical protein